MFRVLRVFQMFRENSWARNAFVILMLSYLALIPLGVYLYYTKASIDTDLRSLSPKIQGPQELREIVDRASSAVQGKIQILFQSSSELELEDALVEFEAAVDGLSRVLRYADTENTLAVYTNTIKQYQFNFLVEEDADALSSQTGEEIVINAKNKLFSINQGLRLTSVKDDPFRFLNNFLLSVIAKLDSAALSSDGSGYVEGVTLDLVGVNTIAEQNTLVETLSNELDAIQSRYSGVSIYKSGVIFFAQEAAQKSKRDISVISTGSIVGTVLLLWVIFRSLRPLFLPVVSIASGVLSSLVVCVWLFKEIHILTIVFGASLIGVVVDYSLHYFYFRYDSSHSGSKHDTVAKVYRALLFSLTTSVIGYAALSFSGLPVLKQVAVFSIVGLATSWLAVIAFGDLLTRRRGHISDAYLDSAVRFALSANKHKNMRLLTWLFAFCVIIGMVLNVIYQRANDDPRQLFRFSEQRLSEEEKVSEQLSAFEPASYVLVNANNLEALYKNVEALREQSTELDQLFGIDDILPSASKQLRNFKLNQAIYQQDLDRELLQSIGVAEVSSDSPIRVDNQFKPLEPKELWSSKAFEVPMLWFESEGEHYALLLIPKSTNVDALRRQLNSVNDAEFYSTVENTEATLKDLRETATAWLLLACVFIFALVAFRYRSISSACIVLIPFGAIIVTYTCIQFLAGGLNLFHVMALFLVLGLGMDYVIFVREMSDHLVATLKAVSLSCITSLLAFGLLSLSSMPAVNAFGVAILIGNTCNFLGAIFLASILNNTARC